MAAKMQVSPALKVDLGGAAHVQIDMSRVNMTDDQRTIVNKLLASIKSSDQSSLLEDDKCEVGKCVASKYLPNDEFQKIRGLKATLGTEGATAGILCDFCLHFVAV